MRRGRERRPARRAATLATLMALSCAPAAAAQVFEIADDGAVTRHDRPAVFSLEGAVPIESPLASVTPQPLGTAPVYAALTGAAEAVELSPELIEAVAWRESRLRPDVVSRAGAIGEMQLMPGTARMLGVDPYDTGQNLRGGATYLRDMLRRYDGDLVRALAAYNAGPGAVDRYGGVPPYKETQAYVAAIMDRLSRRVAEGVK